MKVIFRFFLLLSLNIVFSQNKTLFVIDSIPLIEELAYQEQSIETSDIAKIEVSVRLKDIAKYKVKEIDTIAFITTIAYSKRSDSLKRIPTTRNMENIDGGYWCLNGNKYSGPFIDYHYNGKIKTEGKIIAGKIDGELNEYYNNGGKSHILNYERGVFVGKHLEYFKNGNLKTINYYNNGARIGISEKYAPEGYLLKKQYHDSENVVDYYSTGEIKRKYIGRSFYRDTKYWKIRSKSYYMPKTEMLNYGYFLNNIDFLKSRKYKKDKKAIDKLIKEEPNIDRYYLFRGFLYYINAKNDLAIKDLKKALSLEPKNSHAKSRLVIATIRKFENNEIKVFDKNISSYICNKLANNEKTIEQDFELIDIERFKNLCNQ